MHGPGNCLVNVVHLVDLNLLHVELDNGKFSSMLYVHAVMGHSTLHDIISNNKFIMSFLKRAKHPASSKRVHGPGHKTFGSAI